MAVRTLSPVAMTVRTSQDLRVYITSEVSFLRRFYMTSKPRKVNFDSTSSLLMVYNFLKFILGRILVARAITLKP
jgi:hypothetical protein